MKIHATILVLTMVFFTYVIGQTTTFSKHFGGELEDVGYSVQQTADGGYVIAGWTLSFGAGGSDIYLVKTDASGNLLWTKTVGGAGNEVALSLDLTADGGYIMTGSTDSYGAGARDVYLVKTDAGGDTLWTKTIGGSNTDIGRSVRQTADGGYIIAGETFISGPEFTQAYLVKTDANGNTEWSSTFGRFPAFNDYAYGVDLAADGGYIAAGYSQNQSGVFDVYLIKTDATGNSSWTKTFGGLSFDFGVSVHQTADNGFILAGFTSSFGPPPEDVYLIKTDSGGDTLWTQTYGDTMSDFGYSVQQTADNGYIVTGLSGSASTGDFDVYLFKTDAGGAAQWSKTFGRSGNEQSYSVQQTADGGYIIAGQASSFGNGSADVYLIKTDEQGNMDPVGIGDDDNTAQPRQVLLEQNYPNPFNPSTTIDYSLPVAANVELAIYNTLGQHVRTLVRSQQPAGGHTVQWDGRNAVSQQLASGVYLYRLQAGATVLTRKLLLLR